MMKLSVFSIILICIHLNSILIKANIQCDGDKYEVCKLLQKLPEKSRCTYDDGVVMAYFVKNCCQTCAQFSTIKNTVS